LKATPEAGENMNRTEKQQLVDEFHKELEKSPHAVLVDFRGLSVPAATEFRKRVRASGSRYRVIKNSLALRAAKGTALERVESKLEGSTGIAYTGDDPVALAKVLVDFAKDHPALSFKAGVVAGSQVLDAEGVKALSTMPGLAEMRARLLGLLQAPAARLVRLLGTPATQLARVVQAHHDKLEGK
jgi:large subunit ribosomal protein L10